MTHSPDTPATPVVIADQSAVTDRMSARRYGVTPATPAPVIVWDLDALVSELKAVANGQIWRLKNRRGDYGLCDTAADAITALRSLPPQDGERELENRIRERIAQDIEDEAGMRPCPQDAAVILSLAELVRVKFSYDDADLRMDAIEAANARAEKAEAEARRMDAARDQFLGERNMLAEALRDIQRGDMTNMMSFPRPRPGRSAPAGR